MDNVRKFNERFSEESLESERSQLHSGLESEDSSEEVVESTQHVFQTHRHHVELHRHRDDVDA